MLDHLVRMGWLSRIGAEYELGDRLVEVGALAVYDVRSVAHTQMHDMTGGMVQFAQKRIHRTVQAIPVGRGRGGAVDQRSADPGEIR